MESKRIRGTLALVACTLSGTWAWASYTNFESSLVHPIALTPSKTKLLAVNTPDATLEIFTVESNGSLTPFKTIAVGLEPVTVAARTDTEAWVVNSLSDT